MILEWSEASLQDRRDIFFYLAVEVASPAAGHSMEGAFVSQTKRLTIFPLSGRPGRLAGTREVIVAGTPYLAVYRVDGDRVIILRVIHGAREWPER